jgi:hypothetical protein
MTITKSYFDDNGAGHRAQGRRFDDASTPGDVEIEVGFSPRYFAWINLTDRIKWEWFEGMAAGTTLKTAANGDATLDTGDVAISVDAGVGKQFGATGDLDTTNAGVRNNVAYPGPSTVIDKTGTETMGARGPSQRVTIASAVNLQNKQYSWVAVG